MYNKWFSIFIGQWLIGVCAGYVLCFIMVLLDLNLRLVAGSYAYVAFGGPPRKLQLEPA